MQDVSKVGTVQVLESSKGTLYCHIGKRSTLPQPLLQFEDCYWLQWDNKSDDKQFESCSRTHCFMPPPSRYTPMRPSENRCLGC